MMRRRLLSLLVVAGLLGVAGATALAAPRVRSVPMPPGPAQVIVAVGDSITYGLHDTEMPGGWVTRLGGRLNTDYPGVNFVVRNAGVNGDTAAGVLKRLPTDVLAAHPQLVILSIGTNDFDEGVPAGEFRYTLTRVIKRLQTAQIAVLGVSMLPEAGLAPRQLVAQSAYNAIIAQVCAATGAGYLDEFDSWLALGSAELERLRADVEHPNPIGYRLLASSMAAFLESQYLSADGHLLVPVVRPASALPDSVLDAEPGWQAVTVRALPNVAVTVTITATNGLATTVSGRTDRAGTYAQRNSP
jgi:acyl-CoA thioesterase-1